MKFRIRENGKVVNEYEFKQKFGNVSFPALITEQIANEFDADPVVVLPYPTATVRQVVEEDVTMFNETTQQWEQGWKIVDITDPDQLHDIARMEQEQLQHRYNAVVNNVLNQKAVEHGYDDIKSAALRAAYPGPYHEEGVQFAKWMDECWWIAFELLNQVKQGQPPLTDEQLVAELPVLSITTQLA